MKAKYRLRTTILIMAIIPLIAHSQPPNILWSHFFGGSESEWGGAVQQTSDGGYIMAGNTRSFGAGNYDVYLVKTDSRGDLIWDQTYGWNQLDQCGSVQQTTDGGYVIGGWTRSIGEGGNDYWLVKTDSVGNLIWNRTFGGSHYDECYMAKQTSDGGYIMAGKTSSFGAGASDVWLVKTDTNGDSIWTQTYGGIHDDYCVGVEQLEDGSYVLVWNGDYSDQGVWLGKLNQNGQLLWSQNIVDSLICSSFQSTSDGGFVFAGDSATWGCEDYDFWLMKTDANGNPFWSNTYGCNCPNVCNDMIQCSDGGYLMVGYTEFCGSRYRDYQIIKADANGDRLWSYAFGGNSGDACSSIQQTVDGGYILGGNTWSWGAGACDLWLVRMEPECENWTPMSPEVEIAVVGSHIALSWLPITASVSGCPITIQHYHIYHALTLAGPFQLLSTISSYETTYFHLNAVNENRRFYIVTAETE